LSTGDDLTLSGDLSCENAEVRGSLVVGGVLVVPFGGVVHDATLSGNGTVPFPLHVVGSAIVEVLNTDAVVIVAGSPIATNGKRGDNASTARSRIAGIAVADTAPGFMVPISPAGIVTLTAAQWDARTGQVGGLTAGITYWLGLSGMLATSPATLTGSYILAVGKALTPNVLLVDVLGSILV
jgi:hypothetical protein